MRVFCAISFLLLTFATSGCGTFSQRPHRHLSYAEVAYLAAQKANAEANAPLKLQQAREQLLRARAAYRSKNFRLARTLSIRARLLSEEAELLSLGREKGNENTK